MTDVKANASQGGGAGGAAASGDTKLYQEIADEFPSTCIVTIHRKYFKDTKGLTAFKHLCAPEYSSVELQLRHKYYGLAAAHALLKYVEYIKNVIYAPKVGMQAFFVRFSRARGALKLW